MLKGIYKNCKTCGKEFYVRQHRKEAKYCSRACQFKGQMNGRILKCKICDKEQYKPSSLISKIGNNYCSKKCFYSDRRLSGKDNPNWRGGRRREKCKDCGTAISNWTVHNLCKPCFGKRNRGKNHACYIGRKYKRYIHKIWTKSYKKWRISVFERDNYTCEECGQVGGYLHAHHIASWSNNPKLRYRVYNGVTLCKSCHKDLHRSLRVIDKISKFFNEKEINTKPNCITT